MTTMRSILCRAVACAALLLASCATATATTPAAGPGSVDLPSEYIACGCGCCDDVAPATRCLYRSKQDDLGAIIEADQARRQEPDCARVGCSAPIRYVYCD